MKGLELSRQYYTEVIRPFLEERFPEYTASAAAGLVGEGSECFGYDDEWSQDHDWGAAICIWLEDEVYDAAGGKMQKALDDLPDRYRGYPVNRIPGRNGVMQIGSFYRKYLAVDHVPRTVGEWLYIPEHHLAAATNGEVFADPSGAFSAIRNELLSGYPEDIRLKKLAAHCMKIGQSGQYNYPRLLRRKDHVAACLAKSEFIQEVIAAVYLLNNRYMPFYKWMYHGLKQLPILGAETADLLGMLPEMTDASGLIDPVCRLLVQEFHRQQISDVDERELFMVAHGESIHRHICLDALRETNPWIG